MHKQQTEFATVAKEGVIKAVGKSTVYQPKISFKAKPIKWLEDKTKKKDR